MKRLFIGVLALFMATSMGVAFAACVCHMALNHNDNAFHRTMNCCPPNADCSKDQTLVKSCGDVRSAFIQGSRLDLEPLRNLIASKTAGPLVFLRAENISRGSPHFSGHFSAAPLYLQTSTLL